MSRASRAETAGTLIARVEYVVRAAYQNCQLAMSALAFYHRLFRAGSNLAGAERV